MALPVIEKPIFRTNLPSSNKEIQYRPFSVKEQKNLLIAAEGGDQNDIIEGIVNLVDICTFNKIDWMEQYAIDLEHVFLMIRSKSVGEVVEMAYQCKAKDERGNVCNQKNHLEVDIREAFHSEFPEPVIQVTDNISMVMEHLRVKDLIEQKEGRELIRAKTKYILHGEDPISEFTMEEFETFLDSFPANASERLDDFFRNQPTLILRPETCCAKCGHKSNIELRGVLNFFG